MKQNIHWLGLPMLLLLAGCSSIGGLFGDDGPTLACPAIEIVQDARQQTRFKDQGRDLTDVLFEADLVDISAVCDYFDGETAVETEMQVILRVSEGPANVARQAEVRYFLAVGRRIQGQRDSEVIQRREFTTVVTFQGNERRVALQEEVVPTLRLGPGETGRDYVIYVGLILSPEELRYNRNNR